MTRAFLKRACKRWNGGTRGALRFIRCRKYDAVGNGRCWEVERDGVFCFLIWDKDLIL